MIEKILERFREASRKDIFDKQDYILLRDANKIVQEAAKEYGWIPVTEKLPMENRFYIVTTYDGEIYRAEPAYYARFGYLGQRNIKPQWWSDHSSNACLIEDDDYEVVAWMELPAPYQKGE